MPTSRTDLDLELERESLRDGCECGRRGCSAWPHCVTDAREADLGLSDADPGL